MADNQTNKNSCRVREKIKNVVNTSRFGKSHRVSHHPQSNTTANPSLQTTSISQPSNIILIESGSEYLLHEKEHGGKPHASSLNKKLVKITSMDNIKPKPETIKEGDNPTPKSEQAKPVTMVQERKMKPKVEEALTIKTTVATIQKQHEENGDFSDHVNDQFSAYITRVRNNMRTSSDLGIERTATKVSTKDSFNYKVTSFLNRARIQRRTTSNVGDHMKSISFEGEKAMG